MLETLTSLGAWTIIDIIGPILLGIGLVFGVVYAGRRRKLSASENARRDEATKRLYRS
jgi:hypothetical protein